MQKYSNSPDAYSPTTVLAAVAAAGILLWWVEAPAILIGLGMLATKVMMPEHKPATETEAEADEITTFLVEKAEEL